MTSRQYTRWRPSAKIRYYGAASCIDNDLLDTLTTVVDENKASIVTQLVG